MQSKYGVLLADDSEDDRLILRMALRAHPRLDVVAEVEDGEQAVAYLSGKREFSNRQKYPLPDLMVLDLSMPRRNGFDVLEWWKTVPNRQPLMIIVLTASGMADDIDRAAKLEAASYLLKPAHLHEVAILAKKALELWKNVDSGQSSWPSATRG